MASELLKRITGGDSLTGRFPYTRDPITFYPQCKVWWATNHKPRVSDSTHSVWRRIRLIPFEMTIADKDQDKVLITRLLAELGGILRWAVEGCSAWQSQGLKPPATVTAATANYRAEEDVVQRFIDDRCEVGQELVIERAELWTAFKDWQDFGCEGDRLSRNTFYQSIRGRYHEERAGGSGVRQFRGIKIGLCSNKRG